MTTPQSPGTQLQILFNGAVTAAQAEGFLHTLGFVPDFTRARDDAVVLVISVPDGKAEEWKERLKKVPHMVEDVRRAA